MKLSPILLFPTGEVAPEPASRPSLRTPETADKICAAIRATGLPDLSAGALAGVSSAEMTRWREEDAEFASRLAAAREELRDKLLKGIREARNRDGTPDKAAQAWLRKNGYEE
ncbi:MAG TPA: hypothetical protein VGO11_23960 [Chthoniobacteraceae bacterium]|jgi:hypothetical protein|nr:hypothetical protein [Chthoniobacteraceae bacterium]